MSHEMAGIFSTLEEALAHPPEPEAMRGPFLSCEICARRRPKADTHLALARFRAETDPGDAGYRTLVRCRDAADCRATVEAFGEDWPLDDRTPAPLHVATKPAVEVAPDPPDPAAVEHAAPATVQATPDEWQGF